MTDSNLIQLTRGAKEATWGQTATTQEMTKVRVTGVTFKYAINNIRSEEMRSDRLTPDLIQVGARVNGNFGMELSYSAYDEDIESALFSTWQKMPVIVNSAPDTEITGVVNSTHTFSVASGGASYKTGHLVRASAFTNSGNNQRFRVASSTGTTIVGPASGFTLTDESAPPTGARLKVVGFEGASGDITAVSNGLGSTALDYTTLGLTVGQWIKIGGSAAGNKFATAACNAMVRITAIAATLLTCDNLPSGWATDNGSSKAIQVFTGDYIRPGVTMKSMPYELGFLGQTVPNYAVMNGMVVNSWALNMEAGAIVNGTFEFLGKIESTSTTSLDTTPTAAPAYDVMNAVNDVSRIAVGGALVTGPNFVKSLSLNIANNLRELMAIGSVGLVGIGKGDFDITGKISTYFEDMTIYNNYVNGTSTSVNTVVTKGNNAYVFSIPKLKFEDGDKPASGRNQDVMVDLQFRGILDTLTNTVFQIDRFEELS